MPVANATAWRVAGSYLEACNCEAICPCRRIDGTPGGRSTYGVCMGALSWAIAHGHAGETDLSGLAVVLACRYSDEAPGSPWDFVLYVDERGDERQRGALAEIFTGAAGGTALEHFPWAWKPSNRLAVRTSAIEIDHKPRLGWFRAGNAVNVRVRGPVSDAATVTCVVPGHERSGQELVADDLRVTDPELAFAFSGRCAYESTFDYRSDGG